MGIGSVPLNHIALIMSEADNVAVAKSDIKQNSVLLHRGYEITVKDDIPAGHRFAIMDILNGELLNQYGHSFGVSKGIERGALVSREYVKPFINDYRDIARRRIEGLEGVRRLNLPVFGDSGRTFEGYLRSGGRIGTRNYYLIVPASLCASDVASKLASHLDRGELASQYANLDGVVAAAHTEGCGCNDGAIIDRLILTLKNTIIHPNVGGVLIIDLGCEKINGNNLIDSLGDLSDCGKPVDAISIQECGGTGKTLSRGREIIKSRLKEVSSVKRSEVPLSRLIAGTECGASDTFSGITANPLIGATVDKLIAAGGAAILSETPEMLGAEAALVGRIASKRVLDKFVRGFDYYKGLAKKLDVAMDGNFVEGNVKGGLLNLTLKSLGSVLKGGKSEIVDFIDYAEHVKGQGLSIMNGPGNDLESMTGIAASGANIILFSTGMGATEGNLIVPVIKISSRTEVYLKMNEDIDFDAGRLLDGKASMNDLSEELLGVVADVASGKKTWAEHWEKRSFQIWSAGKLSL